MLFNRCKKCRYLKCLSVGMDPKWVMSNEEKRIRFKNFFKKKDEQASVESTAGEVSMSSGQKRKRRKRNDVDNQQDANQNSEFSQILGYVLLYISTRNPICTSTNKILLFFHPTVSKSSRELGNIIERQSILIKECSAKEFYKVC